jgi:hypothetical protein
MSDGARAGTIETNVSAHLDRLRRSHLSPGDHRIGRSSDPRAPGRTIGGFLLAMRCERQGLESIFKPLTVEHFPQARWRDR